MNSALLSASLFATTIAPFILLRGRSGIYTYLPGIAAALLLGAMARSFYDTPLKEERRDGGTEGRRDGETNFQAIPQSLCLSFPLFLRLSSFVSPSLSGHFFKLIASTPILLVVVLYSLLTVVHSLRWKRMAEINTFALNQIAKQGIKPKPNTWFILTYSEADSVHGFPDSMAHGFSSALRMLYADQTLNGSIARQADLRDTKLQAPIIRLAYTHGGDGAPRLVVYSEEAFIF
jgi:hypothetical protein